MARKGSITPSHPSSPVSESSTIPLGDGAGGRSSKRDQEEVEMKRRASLIAWVEEGRSAALMAEWEEERLRGELRGD